MLPRLAIPATNWNWDTRRYRARRIQQPIKLGKEFTKSVDDSALVLGLCHSCNLLWAKTLTITPSANMITYISTQKAKEVVPML